MTTCTGYNCCVPSVIRPRPYTIRWLMVYTDCPYPVHTLPYWDPWRHCAHLWVVSYLRSWHLRCSQRCSMGLKSRNWPGLSSTSILLSENHFFACLEVCLGSLSCWKYHLCSGISNSSKLSTSPSPKYHSIVLHLSFLAPPWASQINSSPYSSIP